MAAAEPDIPLWVSAWDVRCVRQFNEDVLAGCSVLQRVAACCSVLQFVGMGCAVCTAV